MGGFVDKNRTNIIVPDEMKDNVNFDPVEIVRSYINSDLSICNIEMDRGAGFTKIVYTVDGHTHGIEYDCGIVKSWDGIVS